MTIHPDFRSAALEAEMIAFAEAQFSPPDDQGVRRMFIMANEDDGLRNNPISLRY